MAEDIGSLYVRLGLDISELETGFVAVGRTVNENVRRLNRESDLVRLRAEVEITGLDEASDAERILQIRQESLNRQMEIQRDRVRILTAELQNLTQAHGDEAVITQRAAIRLERERLALAQLDRDLRGLNNTSEETNSLFDELSDMLPSMPTKLQAIGIAAGLVASGFGAATAAVKEMMEDFRELQTQSYELNLPVNDTKQLLRELKLAGGDIGDFEGYIRGITDAYVKGEYDDPEFIALRRYGAEIVDATGKLKNFADIFDEVFKAWEKAEAEGNGIEFLQLTGGESGIRDAIQLFMRLKEAKEDAAKKIYDANLDADQLHELDRAFALVEEQAKELKDAIGNIFVPAAQTAAENFFNALHDGTEWLVENKDAIQKWGFIAEEVFSTIADKVAKGYTAVGEFIEEAMKPKNTTGGMAWRYGSAQTPYGVDKMKRGITEATESYGVFNEAVERGKEKQKEFNNEIGGTTKSWADFRREVEETDNKLKEGGGNPLSQYGWQRVQQFRAELDELRAELDNWGNDYETALAQLELWRDQELTQKNYVSTAEREAIEELYSAKLEQIEQERADKIEEIRKSVDAELKTSLENRLAKIEEEKEAWISAGMEEAEAEQLAEQQKTSYINGVESELAATILGLRQTALQQKLSQIEQEKQAWIDKGASEAQAEELAQERIRQANEETEQKLNAIRESVAALDRSELENKLAAIEREKEAWIQAGMEIAEAQELANKKAQKAYQEDAQKAEQAAKQKEQAEKAYQKQVEQYYKQVERAYEEAERKNKAARDEALNFLKSEAENFEAFLKGGYEGLRKKLYNDLIASGVNPKHLEQMTPEKLEDYKAAKEAANKSFLPKWQDLYSAELPDYPELPESLKQLQPAAQNTKESLDGLSESANRAADKLNGLELSNPESYNDNYLPYAPIGAVGAYQQPDGTILIENLDKGVKRNNPLVDYEGISGNVNDYNDIVAATEESLKDLNEQVNNTVEQIANFDDSYSQLEAPAESFEELNTATRNANESLNEIPTAVQGISDRLSELVNPQTNETINPFENLEPAIENVTKYFTDFGAGVEEVTIKINSLYEAIENFLSQGMNSQESPAQEKIPVEVNTTIEIDEAHAWDYDHIQELAEKVAAMITPTIINAIGGDSNSY